MAAVHQIVVLGASFAGLSVAQGLLKDVLPQITNQKFKVVQIAPNEEFFWKIGAPRVVVNPKSLPLDKALLPIAPHFQKYSAEQYQFIKAAASSIDASTKTVHLDTNATVQYDSLIISTGTYFNSPLWSISSGKEALVNAIKEMNEKIPSAETIVVAGGGPAGIETAGELGELYGKKKEITLLSGSPALLNRLQNKKVGQDAQGRLEKQGVKVIHDNVRVTSHTTEGGKEVLQLSNGQTMTADVYIEAVGDKPNSKFAPPEWLSPDGKIKTDPQTLRLDVPGVTGVYVYGTVASYSNGSIGDVMFAKKPVLETLRLDLQGEGMLCLIHEFHRS